MTTKNDFKRLAMMPLVLWKHGSIAPHSIQLPPEGNEVFLNPKDDRAYKKLILDVARGRQSTPMMFWQDHAVRHPNATMMDIGTNYGECLFSPKYDFQQCIAIEANPGLCDYLRKSANAHSHPHITVVNTLLGDENKDDVSFYYHPKWTGGGSGIASNNTNATEVNLPQRTLDHIAAELKIDPSKPLVFKMDVEGFEAKVFNGFEQFSSFENHLGILEFDTDMIERSGEDAKTLFEHLTQKSLLFLSHLRTKAITPIADWNSLASRWDGHFHCDLIIASSTEMLADAWQPVSGSNLKAA